MSTKGEPPDFILCIGDDRSDEDMFESISNAAPSSAEVFACTVGRKPSKATYYLNDTEEVIRLLESLAITPDESLQQTFGQVLFESSA